MREIKLSGTKCVLRVTTDGEKLYATLSPEAGTVFGDTPCVTVDVTYNGEVISLTDEKLDACAAFTYAEAREITLSGEKIVVEGTRRKKITFSWDESAGSESVDVSYSIDKIKELYASKLTVTAAAREGLCICPIEISCAYTDRSGNLHVRKCALTEAGDGTYVYENPMSDILVGAGARMQYRIEFACYADEATAGADFGERFLGLVDITTPSFIISPSHGQSAPFSLVYPYPVAGAGVRVSWQALSDANTFTLERSCDGGEYVRVYEGGKRSFVDTVPAEAVTVAYRVRSVSSSWWYGESETVGHSNLYIGTPQGIRAAIGLYVGEGEGVRELVPIMSVGGIK
jgi:hypothetical protein